MAVIALDAARQSRGFQFRAYIDSLDKVDLMGEFMRLMDASAGRKYQLPEAENTKYVLEKLLKVSDTEPFRFQLRRSLKVLNEEIRCLKSQSPGSGSGPIDHP